MTLCHVCSHSEQDDNRARPCARVEGCASYLHLAVVAEVAAQCEQTPDSKGQMPCMCFFNMTELDLPAVLQQQRKSTTGAPAS